MRTGSFAGNALAWRDAQKELTTELGAVDDAEQDDARLGEEAERGSRPARLLDAMESVLFTLFVLCAVVVSLAFLVIGKNDPS